MESRYCKAADRLCDTVTNSAFGLGIQKLRWSISPENSNQIECQTLVGELKEAFKMRDQIAQKLGIRGDEIRSYLGDGKNILFTISTEVLDNSRFMQPLLPKCSIFARCCGAIARSCAGKLPPEEKQRLVNR